MRYYATSLAEKNIRVNTVHPCGVATPMILNEVVAQNLVEHPEGNTLRATTRRRTCYPSR